MVETALRFDMRSPSFGPSAVDQYATAIALAERADSLGFDYIQISEHHGAGDGYCPSPIAFAAAVAARTTSTRIRISALVLPLHHPVRIAEDLAVVDLISNGRLDVVIGAGYRESEFDAMGVPFPTRGRAVEIGVERLRLAWTGESFQWDGNQARVTPRPVQRPHPPLLLAGSSNAAARRAARLDLPFAPTAAEFYGPYEAECRRLGRRPRGRTVPLAYVTHVATDPEKQWARDGDHFLYDMNQYGSWVESTNATTSFTSVADVEAVRAGGVYQILTPDECVSAATSAGDDCHVLLHPLVGGRSLDAAWETVETFAETTLPALRAAEIEA